MSDHDNINKKLDKLDERLDSITVTLIRNTTSLEEHVRRTTLIEGRVEPMERKWQRAEGAAWLVSIAVAGALAVRSLGFL